MSQYTSEQGKPLYLQHDDFLKVLEPQKVPLRGKDSDAPKIGTLIDIDNNDKDLSGSFLTFRKDATNVDLYENIFVTPQQVAKVHTNGDDLINFGNDVKDIKHNDYERTKKREYEWSKQIVNFLDNYNETGGSNNDLKTENQDVERKAQPKVLVPKIKSNKRRESERKYDEDLIDEVLLEKSIAELNLGSNTRFNGCESKPICDAFRQTEKNRVDAWFTRNEASDTSSSSASSLASTAPSPSFTSSCSSSDSDFRVKTIKKDKKLYTKKFLKYDTTNLTEGPSLQEKIIVLPQMMARLAERKKVVEDAKLMKKRYVLDSGTVDVKPITVQVSNVKKGYCQSGNVVLSPTLLMADCNKERLSAWKNSEKIDNFVRTGKASP